MSHLLSALFFIILGTSLPLLGANILISGMDEVRAQLLAEELEPRLEFIKRRPATPWRADDAAFLLKRLLMRKGHPSCEVDWELLGTHTIVLKAKPGPLYYFGTVSSNPNPALTQEEVINYFLQPLITTEIVFRDDAPYIEEYIDKGTDNITNYLKSQGYWEAQTTLANKHFDPTTGRVNVQVSVRPSTLHRLAPPRVNGLAETEVAVLYKHYNNLIGKAATTPRINQINNVVVTFLRRNGYHTAEVETTTKHISQLTHIHFSIRKGPKYSVGKIRVQGNKLTETARISRYFRKLNGQIFDTDAVDAATGKLRTTGAFNSVLVTPKPSTSSTLDLFIDVVETPAKSTQIYTGLGSFEGAIFGLSYTDLNFGGKLWRFNTLAEFSGRGLLGEVGITNPFFFNEEVQFTARAFTLRRSYDGYDKFETGLDSSWTWKPNDTCSTRLYLATSIINADSVSFTQQELGPADYFHNRIGIEQTYDFRDDPVLPRHGFHSKVLLELGVTSGDAHNRYAKGVLNTSYRYNIDSKNRFTTRFDIGAISPAETSDHPIDLRLFSGGPNSVRSFDERELGPRSLKGDPLGGEAFWNASIEYTRKVKGPVNISAFYDVGQITEEYRKLNPNDPSHALGLGLRFDLPIGPVRFEYGYNLNRKSDEPAGTFHFAIGASF